MLLELEFLPGLKPIVLEELRRHFGADAALVPGDEEDAIRLRYTRSPADLHAMRTVAAVYLLLPFAVPRPKALLGHQHFTRLTGQIDRVRGMHPSGAFRTFRFSAAGSQSGVFQRLVDALAEYTQMAHEPDDADLLLRVRPSLVESGGWDVLIRTTPRPLTTRPWRVCDMLGALNATLAAAMIELTKPRPGDRFFNPMCGSGSLLIERALRAPAQTIGGCDVDGDALHCAQQNIAAARLAGRIDVFPMDAAQLELPDGTFDVICADLPWGHRTGTHDANVELYPAALAEMARVAAPGARLAVITHEITLFESLLNRYAGLWFLRRTIRVLQGGLHPRIYLLEQAG